MSPRITLMITEFEKCTSEECRHSLRIGWCRISNQKSVARMFAGSLRTLDLLSYLFVIQRTMPTLTPDFGGVHVVRVGTQLFVVAPFYSGVFWEAIEDFITSSVSV
jgi:hypothetical protein